MTIESLITKHYEIMGTDKHDEYYNIAKEEHYTDIIKSLVLQVVELTNIVNKLNQSPIQGERE